jgi:RNA polymerase sigma-70 factor (sigma-E family)
MFRIRLGQRMMDGGEIMEGPRGRHVDDARARAERDAGQGLTALYAEHYSSLVRLASLLVPDAVAAEDVVQDAFVALHASWRRLRDGEQALCYLRQCVLTRSRSASRRGGDGGAAGQTAGPNASGSEQRDGARPEPAAVLAAIRALPARQREALVMRFYAELPEAEIAGIMRISERAVRQHTERAVAGLRALLRSTGDAASAGLLIAS